MQNRFEFFNAMMKMSLYELCNSNTWNLKDEGEALFDCGAIKEFFWSKKFSMLSIFVKNKTNQQVVTLTINRLNVSYGCDCDKGIKSLLCVHVVSAFVAGKYFLHADYRFYVPYDNEQYEKLSHSLLYGNCYDNSFSYASLPAEISASIFLKHLVKDMHSVNVVCCLIRNGKVMLPQEIKAIPELVDFVSVVYERYDEKVFINNITIAAQHYPLFFYDRDEFHPITWDVKSEVFDITEIDILDDSVRIRRLVHNKAVLLDNLLSVGSQCVIDRSTAVMYRVTSYGMFPWHDVRRWQERLREKNILYENFPVLSEPFEMEIVQFNTNAYGLYDANDYLSKGFIFKKNGHSIKPEDNVAQAKIVVKEDTSDSSACYLRGEVYFDSIGFQSGDVYAIDKLMNVHRLAAYKQFSSKRAAVWAKGYFAASCAKNKEELNAIIEQVSINFAESGIDIKKYIVSPLTAIYKKIQKRDISAAFFIKNDKPYIIRIDHIFYWLLVVAPQIVFDKCRRVYASTVSYVETKYLYASLGEFRELLHGYGIDLYIDAKQVKVAHVDIEIDTTNKETDWFELHPEVYYEGQKISSQEWQSIVAGNGLWNRNNEILVIDSKACTALGLLSRWMNNGVGQLTSAKSIAIVPRLRIFDLIELRKNGVKLTVSDNDEKLLFSLSNFTAIPKVAIPKKLNCTLREYQKEGYYWLAFLYQHRFGACLADDMGLGKTVQAIALLGAIHEKIVVSGGVSKKSTRTQARHKPHLIVVPTSLIFNWVNEIKNFYPHLTVQEHTTTKNNCAFDGADIFITTYDIVRRDSEKLRLIEFNIIIFDEAQAIKNIVAQRTSAARLLQGEFKLCITGTPLENHIGEYYSIMDLAIPGLLPDYATFKNKGNGSVGTVVHQTRPFILRRTKEVIAKELPEKMESDVYFYMTEKQRSLYTRITQEVRNEVTNAYKNKTKGQASIIALTALLRLRQICISPELVIPAQKIVPSPKIEYLTEQLPGLIERGHAALIFSQFTKCLDIIESELNDAGIKYARIDGSVTLAKRKGIIESFQKDKIVDVLLMSLKTGGVGLNLTRASYVFHVDPWWNAAVENQASDRAYRIGQKNTVMVIRLLMHHSIEEKMLVLKKSKEELFKAIVEGAGEKTGSPISQNDFDFLLG